MICRLWPNWCYADVWKDWWKPPRFPDWWFAIRKNKGKPWYYVFKAPVFAHLVGAMIPFWLAYPLPGVSRWGAAAIAVAIVFKGQLQKGDALVPNSYDVRNVVWRTTIAAVYCLIVVALL